MSRGEIPIPEDIGSQRFSCAVILMSTPGCNIMMLPWNYAPSKVFASSLPASMSSGLHT